MIFIFVLHKFEDLKSTLGTRQHTLQTFVINPISLRHHRYLIAKYFNHGPKFKEAESRG